MDYSYTTNVHEGIHHAVKPNTIRLRQGNLFKGFWAGVFVLMNPAVLAETRSHDALRPYVASSLKYDSNLLRLSKNETAGKNSKSDFIKQVRAGVDIDWKISRQQLRVKADLNQSWFDTYHELDYFGYSVLGQWNWELGHNLKGAFGYSNQKVLGSFNQINRIINNLQTEENYFAEGSYGISSNWYLQAGLKRSDLQFSDTARQLGNRREDTLELGLQYLNRLKNMLGIKVAISDGLYPKRNFSENSRLDNAYIRSAYHLEGVWHYSVKTRIDAQIGYTRQEFDHLETRNFSEVTSRAAVHWQPTGKTWLSFSGWREIAQAENLTSSFVLSQGLRLIPSWSVTPKIKLNMFLSYEKQDFLGDPGFVTANTVTQKDQIAKIGLNLLYKPFANTELRALIKHEDRDSNITSRTYQTQFGGLNIKMAF